MDSPETYVERTVRKSEGEEAEEVSLRRIEMMRSSGKSSKWLLLTVLLWFFSNLCFLLRCIVMEEEFEFLLVCDKDSDESGEK